MVADIPPRGGLLLTVLMKQHFSHHRKIYQFEPMFELIGRQNNNLGQIKYSHGGNQMTFATNDGAASLTLDSGLNATFAGDILPSANNSKDLGSPSARWANIYTADLHLKNEIGDWTVEEGEEELFLHNNLTGKKYAIMMREIE